MNTTRLLEIGLRLGELYNDKAQFGLDEWKAGMDGQARALEITPPDGWPGKNAEQRKLFEMQALGNDETLGKITAIAERAHGEIVLAEAAIQALEAERRAIEWSIRAQLVERLVLTGVDQNHNGDRAQDTAFDDVADRQQIEQAQFLLEEQAWAESGQPPDDDELPFQQTGALPSLPRGCLRSG